MLALNAAVDTAVVQMVGTSAMVGPQRSAAPTEYGYIPDGEGVSPEYLVRITSYRGWCTVVGVLQEDIVTKVESRWEPFIPTTLLNIGNILTQAVTRGKKSIITKATSRRLWQGSTPMTLSLNLKFQAVNDPSREVVQPCMILQSIAAPSEPANATSLAEVFTAAENLDLKGVGDAVSKLPFLSPPGPTPFNLEGILNLQKSHNELSPSEIKEELKGGDLIEIQIGRLMFFRNVILSSVQVAHHVKMTSQGDVISADVNLIFETYEMITVESLKEIYNKSTMSKNTNSQGTIEHTTTFIR
jgi:hypothetical protein